MKVAYLNLPKESRIFFLTKELDYATVSTIIPIHVPTSLQGPSGIAQSLRGLCILVLPRLILRDYHEPLSGYVPPRDFDKVYGHHPVFPWPCSPLRGGVAGEAFFRFQAPFRKN